MAEKREDRQLPPSLGQQGRQTTIEDATVYETPDYRVVISKLTNGPADMAKELLIKYVIVHKGHGVIYGTTNGLGVAIASALNAQAELINATRIAKEQKARNFEADGVRPASNNDGGPKFPRFDS